MLIVCWNVAGLKPALQKIHSDYGGASGGRERDDGVAAAAKGLPAEKFDPFANYLRLHGDVDVLCLQEHRIPMSQLSSRSEPSRCSTVVGYESFWSCATERRSRGFNGVATYAKVGPVASADAAPFDDPELDDQGKCVVTDHGEFVVFNVYVPCARDADALSRKMKFLNALHDAMERRRKRGKRVVLVGDMNLKVEKRDIYWKHRCLNVDEVLGRMKVKGDGGDGGCSDFPKWKRDVADNWDKITAALRTIEAVPRQTTNPSTRQKFDRYHARVKLGDNSLVMLGVHEDTKEDALDCYSIDECRYIDPSDDTARLYRKKDVVCVDTLAELMSKVANISWDEMTQRQIANSEEEGLNPDNPSYFWMKARLEEDGMIMYFANSIPRQRRDSLAGTNS